MKSCRTINFLRNSLGVAWNKCWTFIWNTLIFSRSTRLGQFEWWSSCCWGWNCCCRCNWSCWSCSTSYLIWPITSSFTVTPKQSWTTLLNNDFLISTSVIFGTITMNKSLSFLFTKGTNFQIFNYSCHWRWWWNWKWRCWFPCCCCSWSCCCCCCRLPWFGCESSTIIESSCNLKYYFCKVFKIIFLVCSYSKSSQFAIFRTTNCP